MSKQDTILREVHTALPLQIREAAEGEAPSRTITGYAILFGTPSDPLYADEEEEIREVIAPEAVTRELLDGSDIKMTMFHDRQLILARSKCGEGTLSYDVDERGVSFAFDAPNTADGDKALELVRRGDISGCSFMFSTHYYDPGFVDREVARTDGKTQVTYTVRAITGIYDFTLAADPAYPDTNCEAARRELVETLRKPEEEAPKSEEISETSREQVHQMRQVAAQKLKV